jgi:hypothetical protein
MLQWEKRAVDLRRATVAPLWAPFSSPLSLLSSPCKIGEAPASDEQRRHEPSQRRAHPPVGGRAGVERLYGVANWLGFFLERQRSEPVFFPHGVFTTDAWSGPTSRGPERTSTRWWWLGHLPARNGGACQWRLSFYPRASPLQRLELTHRSAEFFLDRGDGGSGRRH